MSAILEQLAPESTLADDRYADIRRRAHQRLMQHGFPDLKTEAWKYTSLKLLEKRELSTASGDVVASPEALPFSADVIRFDGGLVDEAPTNLPAGVRLEPIDPVELVNLDYGDRAGAMAWLNLARFEQAWKLVIESVLDRPLVLAMTLPEGFSASVHPRLKIEVASGAEAVLIEQQRDHGEGLVNIVQDIELQRGARLRHVISRRNAGSVWVQRTRVSVAADADYRCCALELAGRLVRQDLAVHLLEDGANGEIDGVAFVDSRQHVDWHTAIDHEVGHTNSRESFRILADGSGVGVFNGRIHIQRGADDSHSDLNTANLLLSENARINTKPELEIYAEEVTASHGATIGQLEDSALFYLRSRGLPVDQAMALLKFGFAAAPLEQAQPAAVREWLNADLHSVL
ncbi:SufB/SufD family protein [Wenzhouxiangella limi]|uniref:SufD family Fe-S cluster assembly protein n=1 Tax=Wenzhouxiangella limi TaxID=2707351 RepID=A0A845VH92_9GAMM|nr:SufD family Fe-S cluster assembly protein [Wenzhouxiangella limi]NDY96569.1 SufD family Fe-S cluster assembly protein [Wenzhouxiangella limi]